MKAATFLENFGHLADAPGGVQRLREMVLRLAVRGCLVLAENNGESVAELIERLESARNSLTQSNKSGLLIDPARFEGDMPYSIPIHWRWVRLAEFGVFVGGGTPSKRNAEHWNGTIPWISPKDMKQWYIADAKDYVTEAAIESSSAKLIGCPALLCVVRGMILAHSFPVAVTRRTVAINQDMKALRLAVPETAEYLLRACIASKARMLENVLRSSHGTCRILTDDVAQFPIPLPPLPEQHRIVAKVDELMALCDELEAQQEERRGVHVRVNAAALDRLTTAESDADFQTAWTRIRNRFDLLYSTPENVNAMRQSILQLAVKGKLVEQDAGDEPAINQLYRIRQHRRELLEKKAIRKPKKLKGVEESNVPYPIPKSWEWNRLGDAIIEMRYGTSKKCGYDEDGTPVLRIPNINNGRIDDSDLKFTKLSENERDDLTLHPEDLLMIRSNGSESLVGRAAIVGPAAARFAFAGYLVRVRSLPSEIDAEYLQIALDCTHVRRQIEGPIRTTSGVKNINSTEISNLLVPIPPLAEQSRIVNKVHHFMSLCDTLESNLTQQQTDADRLAGAMVAGMLEGAGG